MKSKLTFLLLGIFLLINYFFNNMFMSIANFVVFVLFGMMYFTKINLLMKKKWIVISSYAIVILFLGSVIFQSSLFAGNKTTSKQTKQTVEKVKQSTGIGEQQSLDTPIFEKFLSFFGIFILMFISWLMSVKRKAINWRTVIWGVILQIIFGFIVTSPALGDFFFGVVNDGVNKLLSFSLEGAAFVFGRLAYGPGHPLNLGSGGYNMYFFFNVLTTIVFFSSLMTILYHLGIMEKVVKVFAIVMKKTMKTSGSETLSAAANIFVGQTEAPLVVKPFVKTMTMSELHAVMTGGFATVAGGVMAAYVMFLRQYIPNIAGHLVIASIMSAPAALAISKIIYPETEESKTSGDLKLNIEKPDANVIEAAARGASEGMTLMLNVAAMLMAFVAIVSILNFGLKTLSDWISYAAGRNPYKISVQQDISNLKKGDKIKIEKSVYTINKLKTDKKIIMIKERIKSDYSNIKYTVLRNNQTILTGQGLSAKTNWFYFDLSIILGFLFAPISWAMGVPWAESKVVGRLLGEKLVLTEFIAYMNLANILKHGYVGASGKIMHLSQRSAVIASYALCGFANFASIGIQIGGIGGIAPSRRSDLAKIGLRAMFAGAIAACMTGTIAGILL